MENSEKDLKRELKELIIEALELEDVTVEDIKEDEPLFVDGLGLDSIDALELGMALKRKYKVVFGADKSKNKEYFYSINTLSEFVGSQINER